MLSFIKKLLGFGPAPTTEAPYKVEAPVTEASVESVMIVTDAVAPAMTPIPLVVEAPAKKPKAAARTAKPKAPKAAKPKAPSTKSQVMYLREVLSAPRTTILAEGGNEFKNAQGVPTTKQNANEHEAEAALKALGQAIEVPLEKYKTGSIIYPGAETGDADSVIDPADFIEVDPALPAKAVQDQFREWLSARLSHAGYNELAKKATVDTPGKYFKIAGDGLTASVQIPGKQEWLQIDLDIAEPGEGEFSRWSKRGEPNPAGTPKAARAKGAFRHILKSGIARAINPDWKWSFKGGLVDEKTGEQTKNPDEIAKKLFGPSGKGTDLDNISTILAKLKATRPQQYPEIVAKVNDGIAKMKYDYRLQ